jgi:hypothetical protein
MSDSNGLTLSIADLAINLDLTDCTPATRAAINERYAEFLTQPQSVLFTVKVRVEDGPLFIPLASAPTWQIRTSVHAGRIEFESYHERGWIDHTQKKGELVMRPQGEPENFLRVLYAWLCLEHQGLVLHACGVIRRGRGYAFFGASGSGKTTVATLSLEHTVLSDDLVIIRQHGRAFHVHGVPFRGDMPEAPRSNASAELCGLFTLVKDDEHRLAPLTPAEAVARLSACVPFVMKQLSNTERVLERCRAVAGVVPLNALHFRRDPGFWEVIDGLC